MALPSLLPIAPIHILSVRGSFLAEVGLVITALLIPNRISSLDTSGDWRVTYRFPHWSGRGPLMFDPNTNAAISESSAIICHLLTHYDPENRISFANNPRWNSLARQYHSLQIRYTERGVFALELQLAGLDVDRSLEQDFLFGLRVLEGILEEKKRHEGDTGPWIVGDKMSYVDLVFCCWVTSAFTCCPRLHHSWFTLCYEWYNLMVNIRWVRSALQRCGIPAPCIGLGSPQSNTIGGGPEMSENERA
ncbi:hypothetical protein F4859DRAFT_512174 [Xylaria cf. heliscus]|nr:hypothetical protein F4859DRAFT_512174 [Xylaria cf. heliscus]